VKKGGVIIRTAAEGASAEDIERDLVFLQRLWRTIEARAKAAKAPAKAAAKPVAKIPAKKPAAKPPKKVAAKKRR